MRETWFDNYANRWDGSTATHDCGGLPYLFYRADGLPDFEGEEHDIRWRPSIHMPRWASRLTLEITDIRVERVNEITPEDCIAEGTPNPWSAPDPTHYPGWRTILPKTYARLWDEVYGTTHPWRLHPWVWVIEFQRIL